MTPDSILALHDAGNTPAAIASSLGISLSSVYTVLRAHRPDRKRAPRARTSPLPAQIRGLVASGIKQRRVAYLLGVSPAYVYRILQQEVE